MSELAQTWDCDPTLYPDRISALQDIADYVRRDGFEMVQAANSGHLGGSSSSTELLVALYFGSQFNFDPENPQNSERDRVLIRGHEGPARYPIFSLMGLVDRDELPTYRQLGSRLQGHEDMLALPGVDITPSGSLGMLLSYGVGAASAMKHEGSSGRMVVFLGDGEEQEGNVSEAARHAGTLGLDNLICILDRNQKQLSRPTSHSDGGVDLRKIWEGYGWNVLEINDGNNIEEILEAYKELQDITGPTFVIANTLKGKGVDGASDHFNGYHSMSTCDPQLLGEAIDRLNKGLADSGGESKVPLVASTMLTRPRAVGTVVAREHVELDIEPAQGNDSHLDKSQPHYFAELRRQLEKHPDIPFYTITPDMIRMGDTEVFEALGPYFDTGIREQHAVAMAHGVSITRPNARVYMFYGDPFAFRAMDQMNAAAQGHSNIVIAGEFSGLSQGENGKTHQSVSQPGALMQIPELRFLEPADVRDLYNTFNYAFGMGDGLTYIRIHTKGVSPLQRDPADLNNINNYTTHNPDKKPGLVIAASGLTVESSVRAAEKLETEAGIPTRVINVVNPKEIDDSFIEKIEDGVPLLTVYNGSPRTLQGPVSMAVMESGLHIPRLIQGHGFVEGTSGKMSDVERHYGLDANGIAFRGLQAVGKH